MVIPAARHEQDRRALVATAAQFFVNGALTASFVAQAPQLRDRIGVTVAEFGALLTVAAVVGLLGSASAGRLVHAASTRRVLHVGGAALILSVPVIGAARAPLVWLLAMFAYQFVDVLVDVSMNLQGSWISARRPTPVMNRLHGVWSLGTFAGGLGAAAANAVGFAVAAHLLVVAGLLGLVLLAVGRDLLPVDEDGHADVLAEPTHVPPVGRGARLAPMALLVAAGWFAVVAEVTGGDWSTFRLTDDLTATATVGSLAFVVYTSGMTAMRFGGDWLQHRLGRRRLRRLSITLATGGFAVAALVADQAVAIAGFLLVGLGVATFTPLASPAGEAPASVP